jgi:hypothetical protein
MKGIINTNFRIVIPLGWTEISQRTHGSNNDYDNVLALAWGVKFIVTYFKASAYIIYI